MQNQAWPYMAKPREKSDAGAGICFHAACATSLLFLFFPPSNPIYYHSKSDFDREACAVKCGTLREEGKEIYVG